MKRFRARVAVTFKRGLLDPQGEAAAVALVDMGFAGVERIRIGKVIDVGLRAESIEVAREDLRGMCERLFVNSVIERGEVLELDEEAA